MLTAELKTKFYCKNCLIGDSYDEIAKVYVFCRLKCVDELFDELKLNPQIAC